MYYVNSCLLLLLLLLLLFYMNRVINWGSLKMVEGVTTTYNDGVLQSMTAADINTCETCQCIYIKL